MTIYEILNKIADDLGWYLYDEGSYYRMQLVDQTGVCCEFAVDTNDLGKVVDTVSTVAQYDADEAVRELILYGRPETPTQLLKQHNKIAEELHKLSYAVTEAWREHPELDMENNNA